MSTGGRVVFNIVIAVALNQFRAPFLRSESTGLTNYQAGLFALPYVLSGEDLRECKSIARLCDMDVTDRRYANHPNSIWGGLRIPKRDDKFVIWSSRSGVRSLYHPAVGERRFAVRGAERLALAMSAHEAECGFVAEVAGLLNARLALVVPHWRRSFDWDAYSGMGILKRNCGAIPKPTNRHAVVF